jgi:hypothetical protein
MTIPNDYARVHAALMAGQTVAPSSGLGKRFEELAKSLSSRTAPVPRRRRFLDYFSAGPACKPARAE